MSTEQIENVEEAATLCDTQPIERWREDNARNTKYVEELERRMRATDEAKQQWREAGKLLHATGNSNTWETADWLLAGDDFGVMKEAAQIVRRSVGTCKNMRVVAKSFPTAKRHVDVTFAHHQTVAALPESEQERLLRAAAANQWTVGKLRSVVRNLNGIPRKQYLGSPKQRADKWWKALDRLTSESQITEAWDAVAQLGIKKPQEVAGCLREMGARLIALAERIETLPPNTPAPSIQMEATA